MSDSTGKLVIDELANCLDIPESAYEKAEARYKDIGDWFSRSEARCADFDPHIYSQGSFRLGTVVRAEKYDLDFGCRLRKGISKASYTQEQLKTIVGQDLEEYRRARNIEQKLEEKNRCWRLNYKDDLSFHMDGVPSIPEDRQQRLFLENEMVKFGAERSLAESVAQYAGAITDNRLLNYKQISPNWKISNSEGYAKWFESRMKLASELLETRAMAANAATVDAIPARKWKSPLQQSIQILKCHRDQMFKDCAESKPISIIITTLAAQAYQGEQDVAGALESILSLMGDLVRTDRPRVPNPVNPIEDFADKWYDPEYKRLHLENNFRLWMRQARIDFDVIHKSRDADFIKEQAITKFGATLDARRLRSSLGISSPAVITQAKSHTISDIPARPWVRD